MKQDDIEKLRELGDDDEILKQLNIIYLKKQIQNKMFITRDIIEYRDGKYVPVHPISEDKVLDMKMQMSPDEQENFEKLLAEQQWEVS
jgi:pilus assembly protein CpaF